MAKTGRKLANIDWDKVDNLLVAGCLGTEVASHFGIHEDTLYRRCERDKKVGFSEYMHEKRAQGDSILRAAQFDEAVRKRNTTMLVWLGKNRLSQHDKSEVSYKGNLPIEIVNFSAKQIKPWEGDNPKGIEIKQSNQIENKKETID